MKSKRRKIFALNKRLDELTEERFAFMKDFQVVDEVGYKEKTRQILAVCNELELCIASKT